MFEPYSRRNQPTPEAYIYNVPASTRRRIVNTIRDLLIFLEKDKQSHYRNLQLFEDTIWKAAKSVIRRDGSLCIQHYDERAENGLNHFAACTDEKALDFIEFFLWWLRNDYTEFAVHRINQIFHQDGLGYEIIMVREDDNQEIPQIIKKDGEFIHEQVIRPCLESLRNPKLATAQHEMLMAYEDYRANDFPGTIVKACTSLESVLKTVLHEKGEVGYENDALTKLSEKCFKAGIYPALVHEIVKNSGPIRNKMGGHGGGPSPGYEASKEYADYMLQLAATHINMVVKLVPL